MAGYYDWYKEHGICVNCHKMNAIRGQTLCPDCRDRRNAQAAERYKQRKDELIPHRREYSKKRYEALKAAGLCVRCGKRQPESGKFSCTRCIRKQSQYKQNAFQRKGGTPRWLAMDLGLCAVCCKHPKMNDKKVCQSCYDTICKCAKERCENDV